MKFCHLPILICQFFLIIFTLPGQAQDNWPQWRGNKFDSVSPAGNLPDKLDKSTMIWQLKMPGPAGASPIVWGDKIFFTSVDQGDLALLSVSREGKSIWKKTLEGKNQRVRMDRGNSASPSPVTDGKHVWVLSIGTIQCFTMDGEFVWKKDLQKEYGKFDIQFGMTSTPLLDNGRLYFQLIHGSMRNRETSVGWIVALDAKDGKEIWKFKRETEATFENKHAYTSPTLFRNGDTEFLITHGGDYGIGHSLKDGSELWRCGGLNAKDSYNRFLRFVSSPVCTDDLIVLPSAKNGPVVGLHPNKLKGDVTGAKEARAWTMRKGTPDVATPVIHDGLVYLARENGVFICVDAKTGEQQYQERVVGDKHRSTPVVADGKIYLLGRGGRAVVLKPGREFKVLSKSELEEEITASPAITQGRVYVRSFDSLMAFGKK